MQAVRTAGVPSGAQIRAAFNAGLERIASMPRIRPGLAIILLANSAVLGRAHKVELFDRIDFSAAPDRDDYSKMLGGVLQTADKGEIRGRVERVEVEGGLVVQFNEIRGFRPTREAKKDDIPIDQPFNPNVNDPKNFNYLKIDPAERFLESEIDGVRLTFLFNMYPFAPYHFVLVPELEVGHNECLDPRNDFSSRVLTSAWQLVQGAEDPDIRLNFNSLGAHASVNHLHFQGFFADNNSPVPLDSAIGSGQVQRWLRHATWTLKDANNPVKTTLRQMLRMHQLYEAAELAGETKGETDNRVAYNVYIRPDGMAFFPRKHQGNSAYFGLLKEADFTTGFAFMEMLGEIICPQRRAFERFRLGESGLASAAPLKEMFARLALNEDPFEGLGAI